MTTARKVAVVGAGWAGELHLAAFRDAGAQLVGLYSRSRSRADALAQKYGVPRVCGSLDELIAETGAQVISIGSPPPAHHAQTLAVVKAGLHVLCDKPVAMTAAQAEEMLRAAEQAGVAHATGFIWRSDPAFQRLRDLVHSGEIGEPVEVRTVCALGSPVMPMNWMYRADAGGGALMQHGSHVIDRIRYLLDAEIARLVGRLHCDLTEAPVDGEFHHTMDVFRWAMAHHGSAIDSLPREPVTADVGYEFLAELSTGTRAHVWETMHRTGPAEDQVVVVGERGALEWNSGKLWRHRPGQPAEPILTGESSGSGAGTPHEVGAARWAELARRMLAAIDGQPSGHPDLTDGWWLARVTDALHRSHHSHTWEDV